MYRIWVPLRELVTLENWPKGKKIWALLLKQGGEFRSSFRKVWDIFCLEKKNLKGLRGAIFIVREIVFGEIMRFRR